MIEFLIENLGYTITACLLVIGLLVNQFKPNWLKLFRRALAKIFQTPLEEAEVRAKNLSIVKDEISLIMNIQEQLVKSTESSIKTIELLRSDHAKQMDEIKLLLQKEADAHQLCQQRLKRVEQILDAHNLDIENAV